MKYTNKISLVPLIALLLAGCSGPTAIQSSTEPDDLYYASTDKTVYASNRPAVADENTSSANSDANADEVANPEYSGTTKNNKNDSYSDYDYYSDDYTYASRIRRFNSPYRGMSYYDFAYTDPYWYGSSFYAYNPFYDPFSYSPGFYRPGFYTGLSLNLGWGNSFYSPFYGGYNNFYNPYGFGGGLFSGYRNGYYSGFYNGFYNGYYANGGNYDRYPNFRARNYGPRTERSVVPTDRNNPNGRIAPNTGSTVTGNPGGRPARVVSGGGLISPNTGNAGVVSTPDAGVNSGRSVRGARVGSPTDAGSVTNSNPGQPARVTTSPNNTDLGYRPSTRPVRRYEGNITNQAAPTPPSFPAEVQRQNNNRPARVIESRPRTFEAPRYEAPRRYEMPSQQRNDSWSQPSRSSSFPSNSGGSSGGSSGGGRPRRN